MPTAKRIIPAERPSLSSRQEEMLVTLANYYLSYGTYPTHRELARLIGLGGSPSAYLLAIQVKGYLAVQPRSSRNLLITDLGWKHLTLLREMNEM